MTSQQIKQYLNSVLDVELNVYIQEETLLRMNNTYKNLGIHKNIQKPVRQRAYTDIFSVMFTAGIIVGIIVGLIGGIIEIVSSSGIFSAIFRGIIGAVAYGFIGFLGGAFTIGAVAAFISGRTAQNNSDRAFEAEYAAYENTKAQDNQRVKKELLQKNKLGNEITRMQTALNSSRKNLNTLYSYNILNRDYRNIYAVASIYGYFEKGRTASLGFNPSTGDQGAYNIYENERRLNLIITNTQEILNKMDMVIKNQYELAAGLQNAEAKINSLCSGVSAFIYNAENSLNEIVQCQRITAYNSERAARELEYLSWMHLLN